MANFIHAGSDGTFVQIEGVTKEIVMGQTWGHLAPKKNKKYYGSILFVLGNYGDNVIVDTEFKSLPDSPWLFDAIQNFIFEQKFEQKLERGGVYKFVGTFRNYVFNGTIRKINTD